MKALRDGVTSAAGGEAEATHALLERHVAERLEYYRINHNLAPLSAIWLPAEHVAARGPL
jgi:hypothetical protein